MEDVFTIGPLMIKKSWLILGLSLAFGYLVYYYYLRKHTELRETLSGLYTNALFWFFILWKLSPFLFKPSLFINDPIVLLYYRPGNKETILALIIASGLILYQLLRMNLSFYAVFNALFLISSVTAFGYYFFAEEQGMAVESPWLASILSHHPVHIYYMFLYLILTVGCLFWKNGLESPRLYRSCLGLVSIGNSGLALFQPYPYLLGIKESIFWLVVLLAGFALESVYRFVNNHLITRKNGG